MRDEGSIAPGCRNFDIGSDGGLPYNIWITDVKTRGYMVGNGSV